MQHKYPQIAMHSNLVSFVQSIFRGIGQVMFQNNIYTGILFLIGIFYNSWLLGIGALSGTIISTISAQLFKYPTEDIDDGLYGFNGALTGITVWYFFEVNIITGVALIAGAILSSFLMHFMKKSLPPFTAPFVLSSWLVIYSLLLFFQFSMVTTPVVTTGSLDILSATSISFGQVMLQENMVTGLLFLLGILINNKAEAASALYAAVLGSLVGWVFSESVSSVNAGLMGYNAILCAIALTGKSWKDILWITLAIFLSSILNIGLGMTGIITLTAPFVIVTWVIIRITK